VPPIRAASADEVAEMYHFDHKVLKQGSGWPNTSIERFNLLAHPSIGRPVTWLLRLPWALYEITEAEFLSIRVVEPYPSSLINFTRTIEQRAEAIRNGTEAESSHLADVRKKVFGGQYTNKRLIGYLHPGPVIHLEDGTNSGLAFILERKIPSKIEIYLGEMAKVSPNNQ
jgi:hypothetical protein